MAEKIRPSKIIKNEQGRIIHYSFEGLKGGTLYSIKIDEEGEYVTEDNEEKDTLQAEGEYLDELAETNPERARAIARTTIQEHLRMPDGEEEVLPPMTLEEVDTFLTEEDARAEEEREEALETPEHLKVKYHNQVTEYLKRDEQEETPE